MAGETTSAVYVVWRTLTRLLAEALFPASAQNPDGVVAYFGDPDFPPQSVAASNERVVVAPTINPPSEAWGPYGRYAREEEFTAFVYAVTAIPGRTEAQARDRLEEITAVVEGVVRAAYTSKLTNTTPVEFDPYGSEWTVEVGALAPVVATSPEGAIGKAELTVRCQFRIGATPVTGGN